MPEVLRRYDLLRKCYVTIQVSERKWVLDLGEDARKDSNFKGC